MVMTGICCHGQHSGLVVQTLGNPWLCHTSLQPSTTHKACWVWSHMPHRNCDDYTCELRIGGSEVN